MIRQETTVSRARRAAGGRTVLWLVVALAALPIPSHGGAQARAWAGARQAFAAETHTRWEDLVTRAKGEGKVTVLGPSTPGIRPSLIGAFQKAFPEIALEYQAGSLGPLIARLRAEAAAGRTSIDLALTGASSSRGQEDLFEPLAPKIVLPEAADPERWRSSRGKGLKWVFRNHTIALQTSEWVFGYVLIDTRSVAPAALTSWKDMLQPQWKNKIASHDPRSAGAGQAVATYLLYKFGAKFITDLFKGQSVTLSRSYSQVADWLAQGKYAIGIAQVQDRIEALKKEGVPLKAYSLSDGPGYLSGGFSVIAMPIRPPHPNAAAVFLNWFLTREGQEAFQRPHLYPSLRADVPRDYVPEYNLPKPGIEYVDGYSEEMLAIQHKLGEQVRNLLGR